MKERRLVILFVICMRLNTIFKLGSLIIYDFIFNISVLNQVLNRTLLKCMPQTTLDRYIQPCPYFEFQGFLR